MRDRQAIDERSSAAPTAHAAILPHSDRRRPSKAGLWPRQLFGSGRYDRSSKLIGTLESKTATGFRSRRGDVMTESPSALTMLLSRHTRRREFIAGVASAAVSAFDRPGLYCGSPQCSAGRPGQRPATGRVICEDTESAPEVDEATSRRLTIMESRNGAVRRAGCIAEDDSNLHC